MPPLKELVRDLSWNGEPLDSGAMARVLADDGLCYTFNMMSPADIFTEAAYVQRARALRHSP